MTTGFGRFFRQIEWFGKYLFCHISHLPPICFSPAKTLLSIPLPELPASLPHALWVWRCVFTGQYSNDSHIFLNPIQPFSDIWKHAKLELFLLYFAADRADALFQHLEGINSREPGRHQARLSADVKNLVKGPLKVLQCYHGFMWVVDPKFIHSSFPASRCSCAVNPGISENLSRIKDEKMEANAFSYSSAISVSEKANQQGENVPGACEVMQELKVWQIFGDNWQFKDKLKTSCCR